MDRLNSKGMDQLKTSLTVHTVIDKLSKPDLISYIPKWPNCPTYWIVRLNEQAFVQNHLWHQDWLQVQREVRQPSIVRTGKPSATVFAFAAKNKQKKTLQYSHFATNFVPFGLQKIYINYIQVVLEKIVNFMSCKFLASIIQVSFNLASHHKICN